MDGNSSLLTSKTGALAFLLVWLVSATYMAANLERGWVPHDDGALGQAAERILQGEMPHRDFEDAYTGGLGYLHALTFRIFGTNLAHLRYPLFFLFLLWVPAIFFIARFFVGPLPAAAITFLAVCWTVPNYAAAVPSWFGLFFASFATLALLKYIRTPSFYWLPGAGLCAGCSFLFKSTALYFVAAAFLFFVFREQCLSRGQSSGASRSPVYFGVLIAALVLFVVSILKLVMVTGATSEFIHFVFPGIAIAFLLGIRERDQLGTTSLRRFGLLFRMVGPFLAGFALPLLAFALFYYWQHALASLIHGIFVAPFHRLLQARLSLPRERWELRSLLVVLVLLALSFTRSRIRIVLSVLLSLAIAALVLSARASSWSFLAFFNTVRTCIPVLVVTAIFILLLQKRPAPAEEDQGLLLLLCVAALCSLIQFPFAAAIYFCYVAPLAILLATALVSRLARPPRAVLSSLLAFSTIFAIFAFKPSFLYSMTVGYTPDAQVVPLSLGRAGNVRMTAEDVAQYQQLIPFVSGLAHGQTILAAPDCPEVYFLSASKNPTPFLFDFLHDPNEYRQAIESLLSRSDFVKVVVLKPRPSFSTRFVPILQSAVRGKFSESRKIGDFEVFWRP